MRVFVRAAFLSGAVSMLGLIGCSDQVNERVATRLNLDASSMGNLPANPFQGRVITSWIDKRDSTMSTMFGNDVAVRYARTSMGPAYPAGAVLSVVTWAQQEDARWFGGKIPEKVKFVEFVTVSSSGSSYQRYEGAPLRKAAGEGTIPKGDDTDRMAYLLAQRAAVMP
jgi:hypothetical protein